MKLTQLGKDEEGIIVSVNGEGAFKKRIQEMGFVKGQKISIVKDAPLRDPVQYSIMDYEVSLRNSEADLIDIVLNGPEVEMHDHSNGIELGERGDIENAERLKTIKVALVGNPNPLQRFGAISLETTERVGQIET